MTQLLGQWQAGDQDAVNRLIPLIHGELQRIAHLQLRKERRDHTLQTTALVNEAYLRLVDGHNQWQDRAHFFGIAAGLMRQILVDYARSARRKKRGGGAYNLPLEESMAFIPARPEELIPLDAALNDLALQDARKARVVELRYFGGLNVQETAAVLRVHENTVIRDWRLAKAWLKRKLAHAS